MSDITKTINTAEPLSKDIVLERNISKTTNEKVRNCIYSSDEIDKKLDRLVESGLYYEFEPTVFDF